MVGFNERFFFQFLSRLNISEKCQTSMVYEQRTPPKKKQPGPRFMGAKWCKQTTWIPNSCLFRWKHCDTSHVYQSIDCRFGAWDFVKKQNCLLTPKEGWLSSRTHSQKPNNYNQSVDPWAWSQDPEFPKKLWTWVPTRVAWAQAFHDKRQWFADPRNRFTS